VISDAASLLSDQIAQCVISSSALKSPPPRSSTPIQAFNILRYTNGQHYDSHYDTFDPKDYSEQPSQQLATAITYLSDVPAGGETTFKQEGADGPARPVEDWRGCGSDRFKVAPRKGDALVLYSLDPDLTIKARALHGACAVEGDGEKWVAVKWVHYKSFRQ